ncbi:ArsR/SmtB family transcription factor [Kineococcus sp. SYSU DK003]|uniref:ArsR/SmtB family transcription factor n=1 Tax=Kineococcus sp. SYSU DK003 TaxID=3383124 RepID=UPI003D7C3864
MSSRTEVFAALGDENRARLLESLAGGATSATSLAGPLGISRQAVDKHLRVLERAGLVHSLRAGRELHWDVRAEALAETARWLETLAGAWDRRLDAARRAAENS